MPSKDPTGPGVGQVMLGGDSWSGGKFPQTKGVSALKFYLGRKNPTPANRAPEQSSGEFGSCRAELGRLCCRG